ncbi:hypothetical protein BH10PSE14_BH10PSE14_22520 [soil metagenome]
MPALGFLFLVAIATRAWDFGNPVVHVDEQFYLLVGDRLLHGSLPYVDLFDRKPFGLFALYAAIRTLPGNGILAYQLAATAFALGTAWVVRRASLKIGATEFGALAAATAYLIWLPLLGGRGGQAPVFYNLPIAAAASLTLDLPRLAAAKVRKHIVVRGAAVCLLCGLAIQIKYTAVFEGIWFGLVHLFYLDRAGSSRARTALSAAGWIGIALAPTLAIALYYRSVGPVAFEAFAYANFGSIFARPGYAVQEWVMRLLGILAELSPLLVSAGVTIGWRMRDRKWQPQEQIAVGWLLSAVAGFVAIGTFFDHYALPLVTPLAIVAALTLSRSSRALVGTLGLGLALCVIERSLVPSDGPGAREVAAVVRANSRGECPYVFMGDTITYYLAESCLPTRWAFPNFLAYSTEEGAAGVDAPVEVRRILAQRPPVIVASTRKLAIWNQLSVDALREGLRGYRPVLSVKRSNYRTVVFLRNDLPLKD